ncbi:hypothetical protein BDW74DRAFT_178682 [Aspergillus multicolor]|uniref:alkene reductase n=1 Tax=Aspergillus multicolor TaxID=41759 RepID=UPI003CCCB0CF
MSKLFAPLRVGRMELSNRIAMAPMTRFRTDDSYVPQPTVKDYYAQRGSVPGTLLIAEATFISPQAGGYANVPGIYNDAQIAAWKEVTDAVHAKGSSIYLQLWALGRVADTSILKAEGFDLVSASAIPYPEDAPTPRSLTEEKIQSYIEDYAQATRNAVKAGFDGVEISAGYGFLIDQFIKDVSNHRTDRWGGSIENRARFAVEVTRAVVDAIGADRTAIRFTPLSAFQGMGMAEPRPQFEYLAREMAKLNLAFVHEARIAGADDPDSAEGRDFFVNVYGGAGAGPVVITGGYSPESARDAVDRVYRDLDVVIGFGRPFTSNPDLPFRVRENVALTPYQGATFYTPKDPKGYTDWEFSEEFKKAAEVVS